MTDFMPNAPDNCSVFQNARQYMKTPGSANAGHVVPLEKMIRQYYKVRGWDATGGDLLK